MSQVNPTGSVKVEEDRSALDFAPLAPWDPNGGLDLITKGGRPR